MGIINLLIFSIKQNAYIKQSPLHYHHPSHIVLYYELNYYNIHGVLCVYSSLLILLYVNFLAQSCYCCSVIVPKYIDIFVIVIIT